MAKGLSAAKAKKILQDGYIKGKRLTAKQREYFGAIASGATPLKAIDGAEVDKAQWGKMLKWGKELYDTARGIDKITDVKKLLPNVSKLNPNRFEPNPNNFYHRSQNYKDNILGDQLVPWLQGNPELAAELTKKIPGKFNLFKAKSKYDELYWSKGTPLDGRYYTKQSYPGPYVWEMPSSMKSINKVNGKVKGFNDNLGSYKVNTEPLKVSDAKLYAEHWWKGYKQIDPLKKQNGGWLDKFAMGGSLPGASGMMYSRNSGSSAMSPPNLTKAQDGTVEYGTPEYRKLYNEGSIAGVDADGNPTIALDEVVIDSGVDYEKDIYYDTLTEQEKDLYHNDYGPIGTAVRRKAQTKKGLAEDTYDVVNPIMYGMLGVAGGMAFAPMMGGLSQLPAAALNTTAGRIASKYAIRPAQKFLNYKPFNGPVSIGNTIDIGFGGMSLYDTPEAYRQYKANPGFDTGLNLALTSADIIPYSELFTGGKNIRKAYNYASDKVSNLFRGIPQNANIPTGINLETTPLRDAVTQPNIWPTSSPLPENMEPYVSKKIYPFNKEQEVFESFLSTDKQLKNIDSKSLYYDQAGKPITKGEADNLLYPPEYQKNGGDVDKAQYGRLLKWGKDIYDGIRGVDNVVDVANTVRKTSKVVDNVIEPILESGITARRLAGDQLYNTHRYSAQQLNQLLEESRAFLKNTPTEGYENSAKFKDEVLRKIENLEPGIKKDLALQEIAKRSGRTVGDDTGTWMAKSYIDAPSNDQLGHVTTSNNLWDMVFKSDGKMIPYSNSETLYFNRGGAGQLARVRMMAPENQGGGINLIFDNNSLKKSGILPDTSGGELTISQDVSLKHLYPEAKVRAKDMLLNEAELRGVEVTDDLVKSIDDYLQINKNKEGGSTPKAQVGDKVAAIASQMEANEEDGGRPPLGVVDHIRALFDEEGLCRDNTCVQTVKDFYSKAGVKAMPKDVYNNREFLKNFKEYGFEEILDQKNLQPGDVLQYYYGPDSEDVKEDPSYLNFPYHMGVYVNPGEYIGDGDSKAPIQRKNMYTGTRDGKEYKKDPFRAFRYIKQNKNGSDVEKAQWGRLLKLAKKYGNKVYEMYKGTDKVVDAASTTGKLKYMDELSSKAKKDVYEQNYEALTKTDKETRNLGKPHIAQEEYGEGWKYSDQVDFNNPEEVAAHRKRWIASQKKGNLINDNRRFPFSDETSDIFSDLSRKDLSGSIRDGLSKRFGTIGNTYTTGYGHRGLDYETNYLNDYFKNYKVGLPDGSTVPYGKLDGSVEIDPSSFNSSDEVMEELRRLAQIRMGDQFNNAFEKTSRIDFGDLLKNKNRNGGWLSKYENGGVIEDDRGQWAHPGEVTKINSNNITMKGVNYPVLGVSDTGDTKMMQPGVDNYKYDGNSVTEYPMAKDGKSLVELDQLTNFTNYNTPQPGGWLDKY